MIDPNLLRESTEKVRGIAYDQNDGNGVTAVMPSEVFAVCDQLLRILDAFDAMERGGWVLDYSTIIDHWCVSDGKKTIAIKDAPLAALLAAAETPKGAEHGK